MKQRIRLNENQLIRIVTESVQKLLNESENPPFTITDIPDDVDAYDDYIANCPKDSKGRRRFGYKWWKKHGWEYMNWLEKEW